MTSHTGLSARLATLSALAALVLFPACKDETFEPPNGPGPTGVVPDFALVDVNPNSQTSGQTVSPRNHLGQISAWYFGHAT